MAEFQSEFQWLNFRLCELPTIEYADRRSPAIARHYIIDAHGVLAIALPFVAIQPNKPASELYWIGQCERFTANSAMRLMIMIFMNMSRNEILYNQ